MNGRDARRGRRGGLRRLSLGNPLKALDRALEKTLCEGCCASPRMSPKAREARLAAREQPALKMKSTSDMLFFDLVGHWAATPMRVGNATLSGSLDFAIDNRLQGVISSKTKPLSRASLSSFGFNALGDWNVRSAQAHDSVPIEVKWEGSEQVRSDYDDEFHFDEMIYRQVVLETARARPYPCRSTPGCVRPPRRHVQRHCRPCSYRKRRQSSGGR